MPKMRTSSLACPVAISLVFTGSAIADDGIPCPYELTIVSPPNCPIWGPTVLRPGGVNRHGDWVGSRVMCSNGWDRAVKWDIQHGLVDLAVSPNTYTSWAWDLNDQGTAVGGFSLIVGGQEQSSSSASIWMGGGSIQLAPISPSGWCDAFAVNGENWVVGSRGMADNIQMGFLWRAGEIVYFDPSTYGRPYAEGSDVSESGVVVGNMAGPWMAFRWQHGELELLEPLQGGLQCAALAVNNAGSVAGWTDVPSRDGSTTYFRTPTIWDASGRPHELPLPEGFLEGGCTGLSDSGVALGEVGHHTGGGSETEQVVWVGDKVFKLKDLFQSPTPGFLGTARAMGATGCVLASGTTIPPGSGVAVWLLSPGASPADLNNDCVVDGMDLRIFLTRWGEGFGSEADFDFSGSVDGADLGILLGAWVDPS